MKRMMGSGLLTPARKKWKTTRHGCRGLVAKVKRREYKQYMNKKIIRKDGGEGREGRLRRRWRVGEGGYGKGKGEGTENVHIRTQGIDGKSIQ